MATTQVRYVRNPRFEMELGQDRRFRAALSGYAEEAAREAKSLAPVLSGAYRRSIDATPTATYGGKGRVRSTIQSSLPYARSIEYGSRRNPRRAPLLRGAQAAGLRLTSRAQKIAADINPRFR